MPVVMTSWGGGRLGGTHLCSSSNRLFGWSAGTTGGFKDCYWVSSWKRPAYVTENVYNSLSDGEKAHARAYGGLVKNSGYYLYTHTSYGVKRYKMDPDAIIPFPSDDPCVGMSCPDKCIGVDKYDQVCQDGICVRGTLIETNSEHCGYTPDPTPTPPSATYIIIALVLVGTYMILR